MTQTIHLLLADDDNEFTALLAEYFATQGITCDTVENGRMALAAVQKTPYDLMVLDIMMPELDGLSVLKQLPAVSRVPVIMLTAKGDDIDRIIGLELGADDYVAKPCNPRELLARIHAVIKRTQSQAYLHEGQSSPSALPDSLFCLDIDQRICTANGTVINMTSTEFDLLHQLLLNKGQIVDKKTLSQKVLQRELQPFDRSIDVHISRLRKKLGQFHDNPIQAVRGKGYQLTV